MAAIKLTPEEFLDLLDRYNTNVKGKSRKDLEAANEDLRNRIAQAAADKKFRGTGITPNLNKFKPDSFNTWLDWGEMENQIKNTMDALQYSSSLDNGTAYPRDKLKSFADFMYRLNFSAEDMDDVTSNPAKVADIFNYYTQYGIPLVTTKDPEYTGSENDVYTDYARDIKTEGGIPTFKHYANSRILNNPSDFGKQVQKAYKPKAVQPNAPAETQEVSPVEKAIQNTPSTTVTPDTQELSNADWLADELRKSYKKDPRGFERLGTW